MLSLKLLRGETGKLPEETSMNWFLVALKKYADFSSRARRKEFWAFYLLNTIIWLVLAFVEGGGVFYSEYGVLSTLYGLAVFIPAMAVTVRRLHDTGRSGWWLLIALIPIIGTIIFLTFLVQDSQPGGNQYGRNPKGVDSA
jgi:uncharacterized membrane protein YhaH (DUF805 family)